MSDAKTQSNASAGPATAGWDASQRGPVRRYKGHGSGPGKAVRCVACFPRSVAGQMIPLKYGVVIALCEDHRDPAFVHSRGGRDFLAALSTLFESLGLRGARYRKAAQAFVADVLAMGTPTARHRPGSYAWPDQRRTAETVWAQGGSYHDGETLVLAAFTDPAHTPGPTSAAPPKRSGPRAAATTTAKPSCSPPSPSQGRRSGRPAATPSAVGGATAAGSPPAQHHHPADHHPP